MVEFERFYMNIHLNNSYKEYKISSNIMDTLEDSRFLSDEGKVTFSEQKGRPEIVCENLSLEIDSVPGQTYWVRGEHRIDVGEKVRLYFEKRSFAPDPLVVSAYEVLNDNNEPVYRRFSSQ
jgi:hypothetical protein